jgi:5-(carboxyamino)imidazole ribonucleotide mutase
MIMAASVLVIMGSKSDAPVGEKVTKILDRLGVKHEKIVASAHRTPEYLREAVLESDAEVFIGIAGLAAALPGAVAAITIKPVIGVPVSGKMNLDSVLGMVQMPPGIPVATVGLDNGENAGVLAAEILALKDPDLAKRLEAYREERRKAALSG